MNLFVSSPVVGAGCSGPMAARMAIMKTVRQLAVEAKVHVYIRKFSVINQACARSHGFPMLPGFPIQFV